MINNKKREASFSYLALFFLFCILPFCFTGCQPTKIANKQMTSLNRFPNKGETEEENRIPTYNKQILGVVKGIDTEAKKITVLNTNKEKEITLNYTGATDIQNKYEQILSINQIQIGEMVDIYYESKTKKIVKMQISNDAWEYKGVLNLTIDKTNKIMQITQQKYRYTEDLVIVNNEELINLIDLSSQDELTIKGTPGKIWSIIITKGHGYIRLVNYEDFIGGNLEVGYSIMMPVVENMLIVAREGTYRLFMKNEELEGVKILRVYRDKELVVDMGEFKKEEEPFSKVEFLIEPFGAELIIGDEIMDYSEPITLPYGDHSITVTAKGYDDYTGVLSIDSTTHTISINLVELEDNHVSSTEKEGNQLKEQSNTSSNTNNNNNTNSSNTNSSNMNNNNMDSNTDNSEDNSDETADTDNKDAQEDTELDKKDETSSTEEDSEEKNIDSDHKIIIQSPTGVQVYFDGVLKGIAPVSFPKEIGDHTITLSQKGHKTKTRSITVIDDSEDLAFSFPSLLTE